MSAGGNRYTPTERPLLAHRTSEVPSVLRMQDGYSPHNASISQDRALHVLDVGRGCGVGLDFALGRVSGVNPCDFRSAEVPHDSVLRFVCPLLGDVGL